MTVGMKALGNDLRIFADRAYRFIEDHPEEWSLEHDSDLEVTNHVLRVRIQDGTITDHSSTVRTLCEIAHADGGWGNTRDDADSHLRSTAFCTQMLVRANRSLHDEFVQGTVLRALRFIVDRQLGDGSWRDESWHLLDAVSVSVGTLLFVANEAFATDAHRQALERGMKFVRTARQPDQLWYYEPESSPVTISAHLLQKVATFGREQEAAAATATAVMDLQDPSGHWDGGNIDHTCDATRSLLLTASAGSDDRFGERVHNAAVRAVAWVIGNAREGGLPNRTGGRPHVERTCDGIDTVLKLWAFEESRPELVRFWR